MSARTALIVDDSRSARFALRRHLESHAYQVETAESAEEAYSLLKGCRPEVIFMDHVMPGTDGFTALQHLKQDPETGAIPVIICSSNEGDAFTAEARAMGAVDVLQKPPSPEQLTRVLQNLQTLAAELKAARPQAPAELPAATTPAKVTSLREPEVALGQAVMSALRQSLHQGDAEALALGAEIDLLEFNDVGDVASAAATAVIADCEEELATAALASTQVIVSPPLQATVPPSNISPPPAVASAATATAPTAPALRPAAAAAAAIMPRPAPSAPAAAPPTLARPVPPPAATPRPDLLESRLRKLTQDFYGHVAQLRATVSLLESRIPEPDHEREQQLVRDHQTLMELQLRASEWESRFESRLQALQQQLADAESRVDSRLQDLEQRLTASLEQRLQDRLAPLASGLQGLLAEPQGLALQEAILGELTRRLQAQQAQVEEQLQTQQAQIGQVVEQARATAVEEAHAASERTVMSAAARIADQLADSILRGLGRA